MQHATRSSKIGIVLLDEQEITREGLALRINAEPNMKVVASSGDLRSTAASLSMARVDVALVVVDLNERDAFAGIRMLRAVRPHLGIALLTARACLGIVARSQVHNVNALVTTREPFSVLREAISAAVADRLWYSPAFQARGFTPRADAAPSGHEQSELSRLTPRECQVVIHLANGQSVKQTALALGLATSTIDNHRQRIMKKLGVHSVIGLVRLAIREGLIEV